jgi:hypothetical protein
VTPAQAEVRQEMPALVVIISHAEVAQVALLVFFFSDERIPVRHIVLAANLAKGLVVNIDKIHYFSHFKLSITKHYFNLL